MKVEFNVECEEWKVELFSCKKLHSSLFTFHIKLNSQLSSLNTKKTVAKSQKVWYNFIITIIRYSIMHEKCV